MSDTRLFPNARLHTPWGYSDDGGKVYADGIVFYSTPSHGGFRLSPDRQEQMPAALRLGSPDLPGWYEEDCEAARVIAVFRAYFTPEQVANAHTSLRAWAPDAWTAWTGYPVKPEESHVIRDRLFKEAHKNDWVSIAAWGDWHETVPKGMVGVCCTKGGIRNGATAKRPEAWFLVPEKDYDARGEGGWVAPADATPWSPHA